LAKMHQNMVLNTKAVAKKSSKILAEILVKQNSILCTIYFLLTNCANWLVIQTQGGH
jgi:hypothetical protein